MVHQFYCYAIPLAVYLNNVVPCTLVIFTINILPFIDFLKQILKQYKTKGNCNQIITRIQVLQLWAGKLKELIQGHRKYLM